MTGNWTDVDSFIDLIDHIWIGLVAIAVAGVPSYFAARNHGKLKKIEGQVVNGHADAPPLRAVLDRVILKLEELAADVSCIRHDLNTERQERMLDNREMRDERRIQMRELREDVDGRFKSLNNRLDDQV